MTLCIQVHVCVQYIVEAVLTRLSQCLQGLISVPDAQFPARALRGGLGTAITRQMVAKQVSSALDTFSLGWCVMVQL